MYQLIGLQQSSTTDDPHFSSANSHIGGGDAQFSLANNLSNYALRDRLDQHLYSVQTDSYPDSITPPAYRAPNSGENMNYAQQSGGGDNLSFTHHSDDLYATTATSSGENLNYSSHNSGGDTLNYSSGGDRPNFSVTNVDTSLPQYSIHQSSDPNLNSADPSRDFTTDPTVGLTSLSSPPRSYNSSYSSGGGTVQSELSGAYLVAMEKQYGGQTGNHEEEVTSSDVVVAMDAGESPNNDDMDLLSLEIEKER